MTTMNEQVVHVVGKEIEEMMATVKELPEKTIRWNPSAEEWSIMQIISHVAEAIPFWLGEIRRIIANPEKKWGRGLTDEARLQAVSEENVHTKTVEEVIAELKKIPALVEETVQPLTSDQLTIVAPSKNPNFKGKPVQFIVDKLVVGHIEGHNEQILRNLSKC